MNLVNFLHEFGPTGVGGFSHNIWSAAVQLAGELGPGAVVPGHQARHAVTRRDESLVVDTTHIA